MTFPNSTPTRLNEKFYLGDKCWIYDATFVMGRHKCRVHICKSAFAKTSFLIGEVLDPVHLSWNQLVIRPMTPEAHCYTALFRRPNEDIEPFRRDADSILEELAVLLN